jgi:hypothetical protein
MYGSYCIEGLSWEMSFSPLSEEGLENKTIKFTFTAANVICIRKIKRQFM